MVKIAEYEKGISFKKKATVLERTILHTVHKTIKKVSDDIEIRFHFNTAISAIMEMVNFFYSLDLHTLKKNEVELLSYLYGLKTLLVLLSPFVPHIAEELWHRIGQNSFLLNEPWPVSVIELSRQEVITVVVQVNGKLRAKFETPMDSDEELLKKTAINHENILKYTNGKAILKTIVVKNKLVNIVVK